jgi:hypothetical protein
LLFVVVGLLFLVYANRESASSNGRHDPSGKKHKSRKHKSRLDHFCLTGSFNLSANRAAWYSFADAVKM